MTWQFPEVLARRVRLYLTATTNNLFQKYPAFNNYKQNIDSFYENRKFAFAWFDSKGIIEQAGNLLNRMVNINQEGLPDSIFYKAEFTDAISNDGLDSANKPAVYTELMLTAQYFYYADKVWQGFNDKTLTSIDWFCQEKKFHTHKCWIL